MVNTVKLNLAGFRALRTSPEVRKFVQELAEEIATDAGGVDAVEDVPRNRARSAVVGAGYDADAMMAALGRAMGRH